VTLLPHQQRGLYCHSSLPDDLGIQYQSYQSKESIVAANEVRPTLNSPPVLSFPLLDPCPPLVRRDMK
jgi:hypothetical protein